MRAEAAEGAVSRTRERKTSTSYALGLLCECGARRSDGSRRWCAEYRYSKAPWEMSSVEAATSPWWRDADGVLARVRGDAAVVREIICRRGPSHRPQRVPGG
jgi:hypothetical protein